MPIYQDTVTKIRPPPMHQFMLHGDGFINKHRNIYLGLESIFYIGVIGVQHGSNTVAPCALTVATAKHWKEEGLTS